MGSGGGRCGVMTDVPTNLIDRFWSKVQKHDGCWLWMGARSRETKDQKRTRQSYGHLKFRGKYWLAHRFAYELAVGPIPDGLTIDHLCRNPLCCRPSHLEAVPMKVNIFRGSSFAAHNSAKATCVNGHPFDEKNTYRHGNRRRYCRACNADAVRRNRERKQLARSAE